MQYRTDLAIEQATSAGSTGGLCMHTARMGVFTRTEVEVQSLEAARRLGKSMGRYITFETAPVHSLDQTTREALSGQISCAVRELLPPFGDVLVVGLGNRHITSDALGSRVCESALATRHLKDALPPALQGRLRGVSALADGQTE